MKLFALVLLFCELDLVVGWAAGPWRLLPQQQTSSTRAWTFRRLSTALAVKGGPEELPGGKPLRGSENRREWMSRGLLRVGVCASALAGRVAVAAEEQERGMPLYDTEILASATDELPTLISLPLTQCGGAYCTRYAIDGSLYRGILDTGSPFLLVDKVCNPTLWGCYKKSEASGLSDTFERFASGGGDVAWRKGLLTLSSGSDDSGTFFAYRTVFGLLPVELTRQMSGGGVFIGLIKDRADESVRPTFLGQTDISAMRFDFPGKRLILSSRPLIPADRRDAVRLVDLGPLGDPVKHYAARVGLLRMNGIPLRRRHKDITRKQNQVFCIIDTGMTGMAMSTDLFNHAFQVASDSFERPFRSVDVQLEAENGNPVTLSAIKPITTAVDVTWRGFANRDVIVIGLAFLEQGGMTIDIDSKRMVVDVSPSGREGGTALA